MAESDTARALPTGTVTLVLGDIEGSTRLWETRPAEMSTALAALDAAITAAVEDHHGSRPVEQGEGDSFVAAFARCSDALRAARALQAATNDGLLRLRIAIHTGEVQLRDAGNYMGPSINRTARIRDLGQGGQVLLSQTAADLAADDLPDGAALVDMGVHPLRDLARAERIWLLSDVRLPADPRPLRSAGPGRSNLPAELTSFIGRARELEELDDLLAGSRALTLTGAGGCGKTRLALQLSRRVPEMYTGGIFFIDLASTNQINGVEPAVAEAMGVVLQTAPALAALARAVGKSSTLVVLDNCEHLISDCAALAESLLRACPALTVLSTSREPLGIDGEVTYRVPSLALPHEAAPSEELADFESIQLFVERAARARPGFVLDAAAAPAVIEICRRLDGIPLAIELAAARLRVLSPDQVRDGLNDRFRLLTGGARSAMPRQQTLQASVEWSYALLLEPERMLLSRLSVFAGGFTLTAAQAVCSGDGIDAHHVLDLLMALVDKSLVLEAQADPGRPGRFNLLETVRAYGATRLVDDGQAEAIRVHHYRWCLELTAQEGRGESEYRERINADYDNIRRALQWADGQSEGGVLARLASRLYLYWATGTRMCEGAQWFEKVVQGEDDPGRLANALGRHALLLSLANDYQKSVEQGRRAVEMTRAQNDPARLAWTLLYLAQSFPSFEEQVRCIEEALDIATELGDLQAMAWALSQQGWQRQDIDPFGAIAPLEESIRLSRENGYEWIERMSTGTLAMVTARVGDVRDAIRELRASIEGFRSAGEGSQLGGTLGWLAAGLEAVGDRAGADAALVELDRFAEVVGTTGGVVRRDFTRAWLAMYRADWDAALILLAPTVELPLENGLLGCCLNALSVTEAACGLAEPARRHAEEGGRLGALGGYQVSPVGTWTLAMAMALRTLGDLTGAEEKARAAVAETQLYPMASYLRTGPIEVLASLLCRTGRTEEGVRLFAAASVETGRLGLERYNGISVAQIDGMEEEARSVLGGPRFNELWAEGLAMSWAEALAYAERGRGQRNRPKLGWDALTPTEAQVVELVAEGAGNAEIAERLFMAVPTVKTHLTHVYSKLGLTSRGQLTAEAVRRASP